MTRTRRAAIAAVVCIAAAGVTAWNWWRHRGPERLAVWAAPTHPYTPTCGGDCKDIETVSAGHVGPKSAGAALKMKFDPAVDDAVAQWGDCLQSIFSCVPQRKAEGAAGVNQCVAAAACPAPCKKLYASRTGAELPAAERALFATFVNADAECRPDDPGR